MNESKESNGNEGGNLLPVPGEEVDLQQIIQQRKTERRVVAEQRRQYDLQRIRDMKSTTGIDPLHRFPKEIWAMIFDELDPDDLNNVWKVHPVFQKLLEDTRVRDILLPLVVLKIDRFHRCFESNFTRTLRLISKCTMKSYDRWIEENLIKRMQQDDRAKEWDHHKHCANFRLNRSDEDSENLRRALVNFGDAENPAKRFFIRGLVVSFSEYEMLIPDNEQAHQELRNQFKKDITTLIRLIGRQIWHFRYFVTEQEKSPFFLTQVYTIFQEWIELMPNLKWLEFCVDVPDETCDIIQARPFPHLHSLERLSLHILSNPGAQIKIYEVVITSNPHLKSLDFVNGDKEDFRLLPTQLKALQNVSKISLANDVNRDMNILKCIKTTVNFTWPLKTINLDYYDATVNMNSVFQFLNKFPLLEKVKLSSFKGISIGDTDSYGYLNLPNLITLDLGVGEPVIDYDSNLHFFFSLQFLLHCKNLKIFHWYFRGAEDHRLRGILKKNENENPRTAINFRGGMRFLYDSNIWNVFPALEEVRAHVQKCRIEGGVRRYSMGCFHKYQRAAKGEQVTQFLKRHGCCRHDGLKDCVMLIE